MHTLRETGIAFAQVRADRIGSAKPIATPTSFWWMMAPLEKAGSGSWATAIRQAQVLGH